MSKLWVPSDDETPETERAEWYEAETASDDASLASWLAAFMEKYPPGTVSFEWWNAPCSA